MPPLFRMNLTVDRGFLEEIRGFPMRAQRILRRKLQTELKSELQKDVDMLFEQGPKLVSPFEFGTEKSKRYYFVLVHTNESLTDGSHWIRQGGVEQAFDVQMSDRLRETLVRIINRNPKGRYVFGPWQVAGHRNTGWDKHASVAKQLLQEKAKARIIVLWRQSVKEAIKAR